MKNYFINSIKTNYCSKTIPTILNFIQLCKNCNQIPHSLADLTNNQILFYAKHVIY